MKRSAGLPLLFVALFLIDQLSKFAVQGQMRLYESITVLPGFFNLSYVLNPGAAFGIFQNQSPVFRQAFFITLTIIACIAMVVLIYKEYKHKLRTVGYTMVIAGALGNMVDRIRIGKVVDFLDFYVGSYHWYTFNLADTWITVGVGLLIIEALVLARRKKA